MQHLDLLLGARRLWKLRLDSCRLVDLENQHPRRRTRRRSARRDDPLRTTSNTCAAQQAFRLVPIFHHNAIDILTLACLTAVVPLAFRSPEDAVTAPRRGPRGPRALADQAERHEEALRLFRRAVDLGLPDDLLFRTLWDIGGTRSAGAVRSRARRLTDLAAARNPYRVPRARRAGQILRAPRAELRHGAGDDPQRFRVRRTPGRCGAGSSGSRADCPRHAQNHWPCEVRSSC